MTYLVNEEQQGRMSRLCKEAVALWGENAQIEQAKEEMLELLVELQRIYRGRHDHQEILSECADVYQCLHQIVYMVAGNAEEFENVFNAKMDKFEAQVEKSKAKRGQPWTDKGIDI